MKKGELKYFNNREIVLIECEFGSSESSAIWKVVALLDLSHSVMGENFCEPCNIDSKSSHVCSEYDEAIEFIIEDISDKDIFWVPQKYIKNKPVEFAENEMLKKEIATRRKDVVSLNRDQNATKGVITKLIALEQGLVERIKTKSLQCTDLMKEYANTSKAVYENKNTLNSLVEIPNSDIKLKSSELLRLIKSDITLRLLEAGGVDNWDWYGESLGDCDIEDMALGELTSK